MKIEKKEEAEALLVELRRFYGEPVMPVSRYCNALRDYQRALNEREQRSRKTGVTVEFNPNSEAAHVNAAFSQVGKSNLLARLLYAGEKLRTEMCPVHKGIWSGIEWSDTRCPHGCQLTGWIPEPEDQGKTLPGVFTAKMVPASTDGEVVVVRDVGGEVLGQIKKPDLR